MTYAFIIVVSVAITVKLLFLSFSMYYTVRNTTTQEKKIADQPEHTKQNAKSMMISWKQIPRMFLPRSLYCPEGNNKTYVNK